MDARDDLEYQADLAIRPSSPADTELELKNCKDALANIERALKAANRDRVIARRPREQEGFVVLKFQKPMPLPIGAYRIFAVQRKAVESTPEQVIADHPELDAIEMEELRFDRSPRGHNVIQAMNADSAAPIKS
ncbi:hypothetical protein BGZ67_005089 [Mortierella alpina]|nr:hypothetical protein BGZ67_005089 [Mortierella alpina]